MGECYSYVNLDRREYFSVGLLGLGQKLPSVGCGLGGRALGLLLVGPTVEGSRRGSWAGGRIVVVGDQFDARDVYGVRTTTDDDPERDLWRAVHEEFENVELDILAMLLDDGSSTAALLERAAEDAPSGAQLLAVAHQYGNRTAVHLLEAQLSTTKAARRAAERGAAGTARGPTPPRA